jgi:hypothetical protein
MIVRRRYMAHRRAYFPRFWPWAIVAGAIAVGAAQLVPHHDWWLLIPICLAVGAGTMSIRLAIWRRRHPVITPGQYIEDLRRAARWN